MKIPNREHALRMVQDARVPSDLFEKDKDRAKETHRSLQLLLHPDVTRSLVHVDAVVAAEAAFKKLEVLWTQYIADTHVYVARGDIANLFEDRDGLLKIPRNPRDNDLMKQEATALNQLARAPHPIYFPTLIRTQRQRDPATGVVRQVNTISRLRGFYTLAEVAKAYPDGLDPKHVAWIWRRLLTALGGAHQAGIIHGAILPEHIMIQPEDHGLVVVDWCYSTTINGQPIVAIVKRYRDSIYPTEVLQKEKLGPGTDIYMAALCMVDLMYPSYIPRSLRAFARGCTLSPLDRRPHDAWAVLKELDSILERMWGPREFIPFTMPVKE